VRSIQLIQSASDPANSATLCATRNVALSDSRTPARPATSGFKLLVRLVDRSRRCSSLQFKPVNTFSAPTGVAAAKSACATSFTGAPAQMVQFVDRSGLDANVAC
jgi:hypothetical protein